MRVNLPCFVCFSHILVLSCLCVALPSPPPPKRNGRVTKLPEGKAFENNEKNVIPPANYFHMFFG